MKQRLRIALIISLVSSSLFATQAPSYRASHTLNHAIQLAFKSSISALSTPLTTTPYGGEDVTNKPLPLLTVIA